MTTVLIVDDEIDMLMLVRIAIEMANKDLEIAGEATNGTDALKVWREMNGPPTPDVVILDNRMPGLSGMEVAQQILSERPDQIIVLSADTGAPVELGPEDLRDYLARHDGRAEVRTFRSRATEVAEGLLATAAEAGADVLVIGAYGHSRRRELLMGGVTQHIIEHTRLPVLMIH